MNKKIGIAGLGAMGSTVARALVNGINGLTLRAAAEKSAPPPGLVAPIVDFRTLARECDIIVECLPAAAVPALADEVFRAGKTLIVITSAALLIYPEILDHHRRSQSRIIVPSGAICGLDGVRALAQTGIIRSRIASTKRPAGFAGAPFVVEKKIALEEIKEKKLLFSGNALEAAKAFPANVNVAATLSLAGSGPEKTEVEIWADPAASGNSHEITVEGKFSRIYARTDNMPDSSNPKTSLLAAQSIIAVLKATQEPLVVL